MDRAKEGIEGGIGTEDSSLFFGVRNHGEIIKIILLLLGYISRVRV